jgi:membrane dipeptidase
MCLASCFDHWRRLLAESRAPRSEDRGTVSRRRFVAVAAGAPLLAAACASTTPPPSDAVRGLLATTPSFDLHSHPGLFPSLASDTLSGHVKAAETGGVKVMALTGTSDAPVLTRTPTGGLRASREPRAGELYVSTWQQLNALTTWSSAAGMRRVLTTKDLIDAGDAASAGLRGMLATEGCDFVDGRVDRIEEAFARGVRSMQLVHYRVNELGDIQTEAAVHGGLTSFGRTIVREMNRLRVVVDVAHATFATTAGVAETTSQPIVLSHSNIQDASGWARFITADHARVVAGTGGIVGAMPVTFGRRAGGTDIGRYVEHISRLVDVVGIDHVAIGTDMDGIGPAAIFTSYSRWPSLASALLDRGYRGEDVSKILGGNAVRVYRRVLPEA